LVIGVQCSVFSIQYSVFGIQYSVFSIRYSVAGIFRTCGACGFSVTLSPEQACPET
jgi:hypothetical protein